MHQPASLSYRSLALLCRGQAALASTVEAQRELQCMAREYQQLADWQDRQRPEPDRLE
jgi:hypothetical protein